MPNDAFLAMVDAVPPMSCDPPMAAASDGAARPTIWRADNIQPVLDSRDFIEGLLVDGCLSTMVGPPGAGKSTIALSMAFAIALGRPFAGRAVEEGSVAYCSLEGNLVNRVAAMLAHEKVIDAPLYVRDRTLSLLDDASVTDLIRDLQGTGQRFRLVAIDTLARAMAGADENSATDMGGAIAALDRIRRETDAHVLVVHHTGKDVGRGAPGSSALLAAVDSELTVTGAAGISSMTTTKQRDLPLSAPLHFELQTVVLGRNPRGREVTAAVAIPTATGPQSTNKPGGLAGVALDLLRAVIVDEGKPLPRRTGFPTGTFDGVPVSVWRDRCLTGPLGDRDNPETARRTFNRAKANLLTYGKIMINDDIVWTL